MARITKAPEERLLEIIQTAERLFRDVGFANCSVDMIIREIGVAKGTFYYYFKSKEDILGAIVDIALDQIVDQATQVAQDPSLTAIAKMELLLSDSHVGNVDTHEVTEILHLPGNRELHELTNIQTMLRLSPILASIVEQGNNEGVFATKRPLETIQFLLTGAQFLLDGGLFNFSESEITLRREVAQEIIEKALGAETGSFSFMNHIHRKGHKMTAHMHSDMRRIAAPTEKVPTSALLFFILITLAITWGIAGSYIFLPNLVVPLFGELVGIHPLYFIATWGPGIAGVILVMIYRGKSGLRAFMSRVFWWRCDAKWWALILIGLPLSFVIGSLIKGGPLLAPMEDGFGQLIVIAFIMLLLGPMEEFGWRGVAQPLLQRHIAPFWAGALIGLVWGIWHLPAFYLSSTVYGDWNFPLFLIGCITLAILVTPIFNGSRGSLLLPMLFHWQLIIPIWPDAQPWDTWLLVGVTCVITWYKRDTMFSRRGAVTEVIPK